VDGRTDGHLGPTNVIRSTRRSRPNNSYVHDEQEDNPGQENEGSTVSSINLDRCRHLDLAVSSLSAVPT